MPTPSIAAAPAPAVINIDVPGLKDFGGADDRLESAVDQGITGDVAGFWIRILHRANSIGVSNTARRLVWTSNGGTGYYVYTSGTNTLLEGVFVGVGVTSNILPALTITAGMVGKLIDTVIVWDAVAGKLRHYYQGIQIGTGFTLLSAYLPPTGRRMSVGHRDNGSGFADANTLCGIEGGDGFIPTSAEILAAHIATKNRVARGLRYSLAGIPGKTTWRANQLTAWNPPVIWDDEIGAEDLTMVVGSAAGLTLDAGAGTFAAPL